MEIATLDELRIVLDPAGQIALAMALMLLMLSIALSLRLEHFTALLQRKRDLIGGVTAQVFALPLVTFCIVLLIEPRPSIALGMFVVASCPGGVVSNYFTHLARGNVAFSVSLTATSSAFAAVLTPFLIVVTSQSYQPTATLLRSIDFRPLAFLLQTAVLLMVPLLVGMFIAARTPGFAAVLQRHVARIGALALLIAIAYGSAKFLPLLLPAMPMLVAITMLHNAAAFLTGALTGEMLETDRATRRALVFEIGIQNSGLAIVILLAQFEGLGGAAAIAAVWSLWHLIAGIVVVSLMRRKEI